MSRALHGAQAQEREGERDVIVDRQRDRVWQHESSYSGYTSAELCSSSAPIIASSFCFMHNLLETIVQPTSNMV